MTSLLDAPERILNAIRLNGRPSRGTQNGRRHPCGLTSDGQRYASAAAHKGGRGRSHGRKNATATGPIFPWPLKKQSHGAARARGHFDCLPMLREEPQRILRIEAKRTAGCATRRFTAHPYRSGCVVAVAQLRAANQWINRVRRRKRWSCWSPSALTAGAHLRW